MSALTRTAAVAGLLGVAAVHALAIPEAFADAPYQGWLFVALIVACAGTAAALAVGDFRAWPTMTLLALGAALAYVASRTVGLPEGAADVGDWGNALGIASLALEAPLVALGMGAIAAGRPGTRTPIPSRELLSAARCPRADAG